KDVSQIRPLIPPPGCALLITSRRRLSLPGMHSIELKVLLSPEAEQLLLAICPRIGESASELARLCGYLPLALRISASLLMVRDYVVEQWSEPEAIFDLHIRYARYYGHVANRAQTLVLEGDESVAAGLHLFDTEWMHIDTGWSWVQSQEQSEVISALLMEYAD